MIKHLVIASTAVLVLVGTAVVLSCIQMMGSD